jgi:hypothetical protein
MTYKQFKSLKFGSHVHYGWEPLLYLGFYDGDCHAVDRKGKAYSGPYASFALGWPSKSQIAKGRAQLRRYMNDYIG